ncbi:MAG TPA: peptidylprolyl isomerase [Pirellulales bacterium]|nr:peptidylprolyl isomerase [Pirellulales bacterium]
MFSRSLAFAVIIHAAIGAALPAQETKSGDAAEKQSPPSQPASVEPFEKLLKQWTDLRDEMEQLQVTYKETEPDQRKPLVEKFRNLAQQGSDMEQPLIDAAGQVYRDTKGENESAVDVLQSFAMHYYNQERYERALATAQRVLDVKPANPRLFNLAGSSAYHTNAYDQAKQYFEQAEKDGVLDRQGKELLASVPAAKEKWEAEQKIRDEEAKADDLPRVELVTSKGPVVLELFENQAPQAVANFISLVEKGFYNGTLFHRVIHGFMAQGGDPKGNGTGGPGYKIACECYRPDHRLHFRGSLSMAHAGKDTGGSQFFITFVRTPHLDGQHTVFGRVIEGMDVVSQLQRTESGAHGDKPAAPDKILEARVLRKRDHEYAPTKLPE